MLEKFKTLQKHLLNLENLYNMKKYQIKITDRAFDDMTEIYKYIASNLGSPENALRQYNRKIRCLSNTY